VTGFRLIDFVNRVRISRACLLLMESNRYVTHICYDVGFNNVANFNRRFLEIKHDAERVSAPGQQPLRPLKREPHIVAGYTPQRR
jgi:methylphosphotriester-DNA--protein-cysteine methyltransferase